MSMREASGVFVVRIARVGVQERRLRKGEQQASRHAEMDQPTYQATLLYMSTCPCRDASWDCPKSSGHCYGPRLLSVQWSEFREMTISSRRTVNKN